MSLCNENSAARNAHIGYLRGVSFGAEKQIAGAIDFDALADVDSSPRSNRAARYERADSAAGCRTCGRIFTAVELHARAECGLVCSRGGQNIKPASPALAQPLRGFLLFD